MLTDKLTAIEICIQNDLYAMRQLDCHLTKLYEMRAEELASRGISEEEWDEDIKELKNRCKKN